MITQRKSVTVEDLRAAPCRPEGAGAYWAGTSHHEVLTTTEDIVNAQGFWLKDQVAALSINGLEMAAAWQTDVITSAGRAWLGVTNANTGHSACRLWCGLVMPGGEAVVPWCHHVGRHTTGVDMTDRLAEGVKVWYHWARTLGKVVENAACKYVNRPEAVLVSAARRKFMPWSRLKYVDKLFSQPRDPKATPKGTVLALLLAFGFVVRRNPPLLQLPQLHGFYQLTQEKT
jgi:hypothetical protein